MLPNGLANSISGTIYTEVPFPFAWKVENGPETKITVFIRDNFVNRNDNPSFLPSTRKNVFLPSHKVPSARRNCSTKHRKFYCLLCFHSTGNLMSGMEQEEKLRAHLPNKTYLSKHTAWPMHQLIRKGKTLFCKKQRV